MNKLLITALCGLACGVGAAGAMNKVNVVDNGTIARWVHNNKDNAHTAINAITEENIAKVPVDVLAALVNENASFMEKLESLLFQQPKAVESITQAIFEGAKLQGNQYFSYGHRRIIDTVLKLNSSTALHFVQLINEAMLIDAWNYKDFIAMVVEAEASTAAPIAQLVLNSKAQRTSLLPIVKTVVKANPSLLQLFIDAEWFNHAEALEILEPLKDDQAVLEHLASLVNAETITKIDNRVIEFLVARGNAVVKAVLECWYRNYTEYSLKERFLSVVQPLDTRLIALKDKIAAAQQAKEGDVQPSLGSGFKQLKASIQGRMTSAIAAFVGNMNQAVPRQKFGEPKLDLFAKNVGNAHVVATPQMPKWYWSNSALALQKHLITAKTFMHKLLKKVL